IRLGSAAYGLTAEPSNSLCPMTEIDVGGAPLVRVRAANERAIDSRRELVLYWMIAARRAHWNFALQRALSWARALGKPLVVLEALRVGYPWASDRLHRFVLDGMLDNARELAKAGLPYHPYVEPSAGDGKGLLETLAGR